MAPEPIPSRSFAVAAVGLGSNLGDRTGHLDLAVKEIGALRGVRVLATSRWIETDPVGGPAGAPRYLNGALLLETRLRPKELLDALLGIERAHGRERTPGIRDEPRTLDLDLLLVGKVVSGTPELRLPHPRLEERAFVLEPLVEIAPDLVLPSGRTVRQALLDLRRSAASSGR
jgi:2-amino-4-hydroxy-6-hydroxymethyldihydropteridine diphosphokinase